MARVVLVVAIVTLLFFVVLTVRVCQFSLGRRRVPGARGRRSRYERLLRRATQLYVYTWWLSAAGIAAAVSLVRFAELAASTTTEKLVLVLAAVSLIATITGVVWGEVLLGRARLVRGGHVPRDRSLSEDSTPAFR